MLRHARRDCADAIGSGSGGLGQSSSTMHHPAQLYSSCRAMVCSLLFTVVIAVPVNLREFNVINPPGDQLQAATSATSCALGSLRRVLAMAISCRCGRACSCSATRASGCAAGGNTGLGDGVMA